MLECRNEKRRGAMTPGVGPRNIGGVDVDSKTVQRFWDNVDRSGECWEWTGLRMNKGYGQISVAADLSHTRMLRAHRVAWELMRTPIPGGLCVLHHCDNRLCCNPDHLFLGTHADNVADRVAKGRSAKGANAGMAKLREADVLAIRRAYADGGVTQKQLGIRYGVTKSAVQSIISGKTWDWLREDLANGDD